MRHRRRTGDRPAAPPTRAVPPRSLPAHRCRAPGSLRAGRRRSVRRSPGGTYGSPPAAAKKTPVAYAGRTSPVRRRAAAPASARPAGVRSPTSCANAFRAAGRRPARPARAGRPPSIAPRAGWPAIHCPLKAPVVDPVLHATSAPPLPRADDWPGSARRSCPLRAPCDPRRRQARPPRLESAHDSRPKASPGLPANAPAGWPPTASWR